MLRAVIAAIALFLIPASQAAPARTIFTQVAVVDLAEGRVRPDLDVTVEGPRIVSIEPAGREHPAGVRLIDGRGRFLMPGLWDSHVHLTKVGAGALPLLLAHGVTSVRDMGSDLDEVLRWRADITAGRRPGPRIKTAGQILESRSNVERMLREQTVEPVARIRIPVATPDEARAAVDRLARAGADFIKVRTIADAATLQAMAAAAHAHGLALVGHPVASPEELIAAGFGSVEHALSFTPLAAQSPAERQALFTRLRDAGVRMGTTTVVFEESVLVAYEEARRRLTADPLKPYVSPYLASDWAEQVAERQGPEGEGQLAAFRRQLPSFYRDVREMHAAGVAFLPGSDAAVVFMHPGPALHGELASLVRNVGLTPVAALRSATVEPARFFGLDRELGLVQPGFLADLVLLTGNPIADISQTRAIAGVMTNGVYHDKAGIERLLERAARDAR